MATSTMVTMSPSCRAKTGGGIGWPNMSLGCVAPPQKRYTPLNDRKGVGHPKKEKKKGEEGKNKKKEKEKGEERKRLGRWGVGHK